MTHNHCKALPLQTRILRAQEIYQLTQTVLEEELQLDMDGKRYESESIYDVLVAAAVERMTIETASQLLEDAPSPNTVRKVLNKLLANDNELVELEATVNRMLLARLPKNLLKRKRPCAVDFTDIPYHGQHEDDDDHIRRGRARSGTTHFHSYATLCVVKHNKRYTLAITLFRRSDMALDALKRLLHRAETLNLSIRRLYLDREFDNNAIIAYLAEQPFASIMPLTIRGKSGGTRALLKGRKSYQTTYQRSSVKYGQLTLPITVVCRYHKGRFGRCGMRYFAYVTIGNLSMSPHQIADEYRTRFGIETSYRLMNTMRARTTSRSAALRLFFVALAFLLLNLWAFVKWLHLFYPRPGPRLVLHHLLPLARWRLWLWEMVKQRLGFSLSISVPPPASSIAVY